MNQTKKNPNQKNAISVSGIDFLLKILEEDQSKRISSKEALNHHWFINFTTRPTENSKLKKFKD
jgi:serine/threonine protein kinase